MGSFAPQSQQLLNQTYGPSTGAFPAWAPDRASGADAATAFRQIGEIANYPIGQVDVRTPMMQGLEHAAMPMLLQLLQTPMGYADASGKFQPGIGQAIAQGVQSIAGSVPGQHSSSLAQLLFGNAGMPAAAQPGASPAAPPTGTGTKPPVPPPTQPPPPPPPPPPVTPPGPPPPPITPPGPPPPPPPGDGGEAGGGGGPPPVLPPPPPTTPNYYPPTGGGSPGNPPDPTNEIRAQPDALTQLLRGLSTSLSFHATGGQLDPTGVNIVGEKGPEAIVGNQAIPLAGSGMANAVQPQTPTGGTQTDTGSQPATTPAGDTGMLGNALAGNPEGDVFQQVRALLNSPTGGQAQLQQSAQANPEGDAYNQIYQSLQQGGFLGGNSGNAVLQAMRPVFNQNLQSGLRDLNASVPSVMNSGAAIQGTDLTAKALNDFNLMAAQTLQQGQQNTLGGLGLLGQYAGQAGNGQFNRLQGAQQTGLAGQQLLGQLAGQAGQGQFGRVLSASQLVTQRDQGQQQLDLQAQQQQYNQTVNPTLQLLMAALGMATPTAFQTVVPGQR